MLGIPVYKLTGTFPYFPNAAASGEGGIMEEMFGIELVGATLAIESLGGFFCAKTVEICNEANKN
jgi:hypothetical protein